MMRARYQNEETQEYTSGPWTGEATQRVRNNPPAAPTGLNAAEVSDSSVTLSWTAPNSSGITGYRVLRGLTAAKQDVLVNDTGSTGTEYVDRNVEVGTGYHYSVRAINDGGVGPASNTIAATTSDRQAAGPRQNPTAPAFPDMDGTSGADPVTLTIAENVAPGTAVGTVSASDADGDTLTYSVSGTDATAFGSVFSLDAGTGAITVKTGATVDYEARASYAITVRVSDGEDASGNMEGTATTDDTVSVTISVTNVDEAGTVTLSVEQPELAIPLRAELADPDGGASGVTWQWAHGAAATGPFTDISGATNARHTPTSADVGKHLRATASYTDNEGSGKSAEAVAANAVNVVGRKLVNNFGQGSDSGFGGAGPGTSQGFITGGHAEGYKLHDVAVDFNSVDNVGPETLSVKLYSSTDASTPTQRVPSTELWSFNNPDTFGPGIRLFTAPYGTILEPSTTYHVVVVPAEGTFSCREQVGSGEDAGKAPGWSIIDRAWKVDSEIQTTGSFSMMACRVRIRGKVVPDAPHITDLSYTGSPVSAPIYDTGATVEVTATFDEAVDVATSDPPVLPLEIGANTRDATYVAADSTTTKLVFGYTVVAGDRDDDGVTIGRDTLTGGITRAGTAVMADLDHAGDSNNRSVLVNAAPIVESVQVTSAAMLPGWYRAGEVIEVTVTFSTSVTVTGDPAFRFRLGTGQFNREAAYTASASAPHTMVFRYTVVAADEDNDGIWIGDQSNTFQLDTNDAIKDGVRTSGKLDAVLTHAALGFLSDHKVSSRPRVLSVVVASDPRSGASSDTYGAGELIVITTTFSETVTVPGDAPALPGDAPAFRFFMGPSSDPDQSVRRAAYDAGRSGMNRVVFTYTVLSGDGDADGIWIGDYRRTIEGSDRIQNGAGLASVRDHAEVGTLSGHKVDGSLTPPASTAPLFPDADVPMDGADAVTQSVAENAAEGTAVGTVTATDGDGDGDTLTYSVGGTDATAFAGVFSLDTGTGVSTVKTGKSPDYETKASYAITIAVTDGEDAMGVAETGTPTTDDTVSVTITVTDVEETGVVVLSPATPSVNAETTASLTDPDGSVSAVTWQWSKSDTANGTFTNITGETNAAYTPASADLSKYLKTTASYTDRRGSGKSAESAPAQVAESEGNTFPTVVDCNPPSLTNRQLVWHGVLTVGEQAVPAQGGRPAERIGWGYSQGHVGAISGRKTPIVLGSNSYTIGDLLMQFDIAPTLAPLIVPPTGALVLNLSNDLTAAETGNLVLHVCDQAFSFQDAQRPESHHNIDPPPPPSPRDIDYYWTGSGLTWTLGMSRILALSMPDTS